MDYHEEAFTLSFLFFFLHLTVLLFSCPFLTRGSQQRIEETFQHLNKAGVVAILRAKNSAAGV